LTRRRLKVDITPVCVKIMLIKMAVNDVNKRRNVMPAQVSPTTSSSSADEERQLLDPARESSDHEDPVREADSPEYKNELALVAQAAQTQSTLSLGWPAMRTAMHVAATALNPFTDTGPTDSRIIVTALATMLTYGVLPLGQLRARDDALQAKIEKLREDLSLLEYYPGVDERLIAELSEAIDALTSSDHGFDYTLIAIVALMQFSAAIGALFSVLRVTGVIDDTQWASGAVESSSFATAFLILLSFVASGFASFRGNTYGRLHQAECLSVRIQRHLSKAQERSRDFFKDLGEYGNGTETMLQYLQAKAQFDQVESQLRKKRAALETSTSNQALLQQTARAAMLRHLGDVSTRRNDLQTSLTQIQRGLNELNNQAWGFLKYSHMLSSLTDLLNTLPEKPAALLSLVHECNAMVHECNAIDLPELNQYEAPEQRGAFAKMCLSSTLESAQTDAATFCDTMAESLAQACPNVNRLKLPLNEVISQLGAVLLTQDPEKQGELRDIMKTLQKCSQDLNFSNHKTARQSANIIHLSDQYGKNRQKYNGLLEQAERCFSLKLLSSLFFVAPYFERVEALTRLMLRNQVLTLSAEQQLASDRVRLD
jgi:hypothetical protein